MKVFTGRANQGLANKISDYMKIPLGKMEVTTFSEGEVYARLGEDVRGKDVFLIQSTCPPPNRNLMELLIMVDAVKRSSAKRVTVVLPYFGYSRQDRKDKPGVPITAKLVANLLTAAGVDRVLTMDLHAGQIQGFFDIPVDNLYAEPVFLRYFQEKDLSDFVVVTPDAGGIKRARSLAKNLSIDFAIVDKRRIDGDSIEVSNVIGDVDGKNVIIADDIAATAGSITEAARLLKAKGAKDIYVCISHAILSGKAIPRIMDSPIKEFLITDTIPLGHKKDELGDRVKVLSVADLIGEAITRIHNNESLGSLFL